MYYFTRRSPVQSALHQLKYRNKPDIGLKLGRQFGRLLGQSDAFKEVEVIIPVPLHPKKERLRGYNQSTMFARGLSEGWGGRPVIADVLLRNLFTESQTRKKRMDRFPRQTGAAGGRCADDGGDAGNVRAGAVGGGRGGVEFGDDCDCDERVRMGRW